jgi:hypothetical protein
VKESLHDFASKTFEKVCIEYMYTLNKQRKLPFRFSKIGRWWGTVTRIIEGEKRNCAEEIDIIATDKNEEKFILGECKFRTGLLDYGELQKLQSKGEFNGEKYYCLFSLSGFTDAVVEASKSEENLFLFDMPTIMSGN